MYSKIVCFIVLCSCLLCSFDTFATELSSDNSYQLKTILGDHKYSKHYEDYLKDNRNFHSFLDYEIDRYQRKRAGGAALRTLGFVFYGLSVTALAVGIVSVSTLHSCEADQENKDPDEDTFVMMDSCVAQYMFGVGSLVTSGIAGMIGTLFMVPGVRLVKEADHVTPRLQDMKTQQSRVTFQGVSLAINDTAGMVGVGFTF
jgi:hypothetical protein